MYQYNNNNLSYIRLHETCSIRTSQRHSLLILDPSSKQLGSSQVKRQQQKKEKKENDHRNKINIKLLLSFQLKYDVITQLNTKFSTLIFTLQPPYVFPSTYKCYHIIRRERNQKNKEKYYYFLILFPC